MEDSSNEIAAKTKDRQMGPVAENTSGNTPPAKPTDAEGNEIEMGTPPEMNCDSDSENCEMPEPPEGFDGEMPSDMQSGGFGGRGEFMTQSTNTNPDAILHPVAYLSIGAGSVVLGILISYMCFSKFFHLKPGQTFKSGARFVWFIVVALVLACGICTLGFFIPKWVS